MGFLRAFNWQWVERRGRVNRSCFCSGGSAGFVKLGRNRLGQSPIPSSREVTKSLSAPRWLRKPQTYATDNITPQHNMYNTNT